MEPAAVSLDIVMDESEFSETLNDLTVEELVACQRSMPNKYRDFFLKPRLDDE